MSKRDTAITIITKLSEAEYALLDLRNAYKIGDPDYKIIDDAFESVGDLGTTFNDILNRIEKKMLMERLKNE